MSPANRTCALDAHAKINLSLEILGRRPDGYHDVRSVVVPVGLADRVTVTLDGGGDVRLAVTADQGLDLSRLGPVADNLAVRAARLAGPCCRLASASTSINAFPWAVVSAAAAPMRRPC